jgi:hypothetical protein
MQRNAGADYAPVLQNMHCGHIGEAIHSNK